MKRLALLLALLLTCCGCVEIHNHNDEPPNPDVLPEPPVQEKPGIVGPDEVKPGEPLWLSANVDEGSVVGWKVEHPQDLAFKVFENGREFSSAGPMDAAEVRVALSVAKQEADKIDLRIVTKVIQVGKSPNPPPGPDPPVPPQPPTPPDPPTPPPSPAPIPVAGLHVLIVYETGDALTPGQQAILYGEAVRGYLDTKCQLYTDKSRAYRIYDKDVDVAADWQVWKDAMARPRQSIPWVIVSNGVTGYEGPLPESPEAMLELLKKYEVGK